MGLRHKKNVRKLDLLEMPSPERVKFINEVRRALQQKVVETKLWQSLLEAENIVVNGNVVYRGDAQLNGFSLKHEI